LDGLALFIANASIFQEYLLKILNGCSIKEFGGQVVLASGQIFFNNQAEVKHTIDVWKACFPFLREL
jgi:hypothetical protein